MLFHIVADYGHGDLAFAEVIQRIKSVLPDAETVMIPVPKFSTLSAGFCIAQLALNECPAGTIVYCNVAPRLDDPESRPGNIGERLGFARLSSGVRVIGVNAGFAFSFIRHEAEELRWAAVQSGGSQFRSRDLFPQAAAAIALGDINALSDHIPAELIPAVPKQTIAYVDGYGNMKTTVTQTELAGFRHGSLKIKVGNRVKEARLSQGSFEVKGGQLAFAPGSSGWINKQGENVRWMELFLRDGSAWELFDKPPSGTAIEIIAP
jgi:S-adenosylmethionine hydrolase